MAGNFLVFPQSVGWGIVIGVSVAFCLLMMLVTYSLEKFKGELQTSEMLLTGNRAMRTGLIASAVVSSWTIGSTLLLSCSCAYSLGISGPWWYGAGACVQVIIFCTFAIEAKRRAPNAHTYQEMVRLRYGRSVHILSCCYSFFQQICFSANLLINGSSIIANLTGINRDAVIVLLPFFVATYTLFGGIKATFISDYIHCLIIYVIMIMFLFCTYTTSDIIGSPGKLYDLLIEAGEKYPVDSNHLGSLLTMNSVNGGLFGLVLFGAGWAAASDSQLMQKALAADKNYVLLGYILGGLCWFTLPFVLASTLGLACRALEITPYFPDYPARLTAEQYNNGLVMPIAAYILLGKIGAGAILTMVFMACTAAYSSETVAVSALFTHDIYRAYFNPNAAGKKLVYVTHLGVMLFYFGCVALAIGLNHADFDVSFITTVSGIVVNVCIVPMGCTLFTSKMTGTAYILSTTLSTCVALAVWIGYTKHVSESITLTTLSAYAPLAAGNTISLGMPLLIIPICLIFKRDHFDWKVWQRIEQADDSEIYNEKGLSPILSGKEATRKILEDEIVDDKGLVRKRNIGVIVSIIFVLFFLILFPIPLYGTRYIFSRKFFTGWVVVMFLWAFFACGTIILLPLWDARDSIADVYRELFKNYKHSNESIEFMNGIQPTSSNLNMNLSRRSCKVANSSVVQHISSHISSIDH